MNPNAAPNGAKGTELATEQSLAGMRKGARGVVARVLSGDEAENFLGRRLIEIGFVPGEQVQVIEEVWPGGDPMAVRIGSTVFALRRREARAVLVRVDSL